MMNKSKLGELLNVDVSETQTVDFKLEIHYPFGNNEKERSEFIKDILSMANTPREESAYIVIGVKYNSHDGTKDLIGVQGDQPDDAKIQDSINPAQLEPRPSFSYQTIELDGRLYGVIEIHLTNDGPYLPPKRYGVLIPDCLYFRRGSKNEEATQHERKEIYNWFHKRRLAAEGVSSSLQLTIQSHAPVYQQNNAPYQHNTQYVDTRPKREDGQ